ncbi:MAG: GNAT family N-acetyltransferase [Anaerolineae bacterium]|nr:GNAT family N-acetyltransferase [Anaerolineae bacterium]
MNIEVLRELAGLQELGEEWRALLEQVPAATPFQTPEFQLAWWEHLGGGEWPGGQLHFLVGRGSGGELRGLAPLFQPAGGGEEGRLLLLGSHEIADYLDFIAAPNDLPAFIQAALDHLESDDAVPWQRLDLYNLLESSASLPILEQSARSRGWDFHKEPLQPAPIVSLPESWEVYLAGLSKKQRHELRRKMRRAVSYIPPAEVVLAASEQEVSAALDNLFTHMNENPEKRAFLTKKMEAQLRALVNAGMQHGWLQLSEMRLGREIAAVELNFDYRGVVWAYNSGSRMDYRELSPGVVLHAHLIQQAIEQGRSGYDFMRGGEEYKFRMGAQSRDVLRVVLSRAKEN